MTQPTPAPTPAPAPAPVKKKAGVGKWILRICLALVVILVIALVILYFSIDGIIRSRVAAAAGNSTGTTATLAAADLKFSGTLTLTNLDIQNYPGYAAKDFVAVPSIVISVVPSSLLSDTIQIPSITIDGLSLSLEQNGLKNNLGDILVFAQKQSADAPAKTGSGEPGKSRQLVIGKVTLTNVTVTASGFGASQTLKLSPIVMTEPTNPDGRPVKIADLTAKILSEIAKQVAANPQLPDALRKNLGNFANLAPALENTLKNPAGAATQLNNLGNLLKGK